MIVRDIIEKADFLNFTKNDAEEIISILEIDIPKDIDKRMYMSEIIKVVYENEQTKKILENKIFAGQTSTKWYKIYISEDEKLEVKRKIESDTNFYNTIFPVDTSQINQPMKYTCVKNGQDKYMMRIMVPTGTRNVNNGRTVEKVVNIKNVVVNIDLENKYIEVRSNSKDSKKIIDTIFIPLFSKNIEPINVLSQYSDSIESFKDSLKNGKFIDVTSVPDLNIDLSKKQNELLVSLLKALDDYFTSKDINKFNEELESCDIEIGSIPFTQLFLAGLSQIGMATRIDLDEDLCTQSLYSMLKNYMTNQKGFITFTLPEDGNVYTIQVGLTTNSVSFRSSATEEAIEYIRRKILGY